jgi:phage major head subunit gpT-like protein
MGVIARTNFPQTLKADLEVEYREGRRRAEDPSYKQILDVVRTSADSKRIVFLGGKGRLRRFRGERQPSGFNEYSYIATLDEWEKTIPVQRTVLDDDQSGGMLKRAVTNFSESIETSLVQETWEALRNGASYKAWDRANFFDFNHAYVNSSGATVSAGSTYSNMNLGGLGVSTSTIADAQRHFSYVLKQDDGSNWGGRLTHVVVARGSDNAINAKEIANSQFTVLGSATRGSNTTNVWQGAFDVVEVDYGIGASEWIALDLSDPNFKPLIMLSHSTSPGYENMEYTQLLEDSETGFWRNEFNFGVYGRFDWNYGDPRTAYLFGVSSYSFTAPDLERQRRQDPNA